jgi:hypothetical protein
MPQRLICDAIHRSQADQGSVELLFEFLPKISHESILPHSGII